MHLGECRVFGLNVTEDELKRYFKENNIAAAIVQPFPGPPNPAEVHNRIYRLSLEMHNKVFGLANMDPRDEGYTEEVRRAVKDLRFVGIKLHTIGHAISPINPYASKVWELGQSLRFQ